MRLAIALEVGEHAIGAGLRDRHPDAPLAVDQPRVQVLEAVAVAAHDDQVHAAGVLDLEVAHGLAILVADREAKQRVVAARQLVASEIERQPALADGEPAHRFGRLVGEVVAQFHSLVGHRGGVRRRHRGGVRPRRGLAVGSDRPSDSSRAPEDQDEQREETGQLHAGSAS